MTRATDITRVERMARGIAKKALETERTMRLEETRAPATVVYTAQPTRLPRLDLSDGDAELRIERLLGQGGMGQVQLAHQRSLKREVAVKMLLPDRSSDLAARSLLHEGVITGGLEHPSIVPVHMLGLDGDGHPVVVMKRIEGVPWSELIANHEHPAWRDVQTLSAEPLDRQLEILLRVCSAIRFAHTRSVVHRDIKPGNIMIGSFGEVYVLDWGLAVPAGTRAYAHVSAGDEEMPLGTPGYMAPEMLETEGTIDERTDVYLLAATLHRVLVGKPRHTGDNIIDVFQSALLSEPYDYAADVPLALAELCNRAMALRPDDRHPSVEAFQSAVAEFLRHRGSMRLAAAAGARLVELERVLAADASDKEVLSEANKLFTESRFGFEQALREWPGNDLAQRGLERSLEVMARAMLARDQLEMAEALAAELRDPKLLEADIAAVRSRRAAEREQVDSLRRLAQDMDAGVAQRSRFLLFAGMGVAGGAVGTAMVVTFGGGAVTYVHGFIMQGVFAVTLAVFFVLARKQLLRSAINRRMVAGAYLLIVGVFILRLLAMSAGLSLDETAPFDLLLCAVAIGIGAIALDRRLFSQAAFFLAGAICARMYPGRGMMVISITMVLACTVGALPWLAPTKRTPDEAL